MTARWRNLFAGGSQGLDPSERAELDRLALALRDRQLADIARISLEAGRPLRFLGGQALTAFAPVLAMLGWTDPDRWADLLGRPGAWDYLMRELEAGPAHD